MKCVVTALAASIALGFVGYSGLASAQGAAYPAYPHKTVTLITSSAPGGGGDVFLRQLTRVLGPRWGINFVVESVSGSGGANAMRRIAQSPADGSTFYGVSTQHIIVSLLSDPPFKYTDMKPVTNLVYDAPVFYVRTDSPHKDLKDVVAYIKANPGKFKFGTGSVASQDRMTVEQLKAQEKLDMIVATTDGGGQLMLSVLGGNVDAGVGDTQEVKPHFEAGKLRPIAALTEKRLAGYPDLPTAKEQGVDLVLTRFRGLVGHKDLPPDVVAAWEKAIKLVMDDPEYKKTLADNSMIPAYLTSAQFNDTTNALAKNMDDFFIKMGVKK
jgi:putative tricarboxylic transport membrane protein